ILEGLRLNVFADTHVDPAVLTPSTVRPSFVVESVNGRPPGGVMEISSEEGVRVSGWAFDQTGRGPAAAVFLSIDGSPDIPGGMGSYRPELGGTTRGRARRWAGFVASFGGFVLQAGTHTLAVKIVAADSQAYTSEPIATIVRR